jgi:triacylglycerol esterase/lipase EstA (alpha/beta hydrolase family)|eukprot:COSAG01_NODE_40158_length_467_cov_0.557065_1_plen_58_part_10
MGWRSWNFFKCNIDQNIMEAQMDALALPRHGTSLLKLGYNHVVRHACENVAVTRGVLR